MVKAIFLLPWLAFCQQRNKVIIALLYLFKRYFPSFSGCGSRPPPKQDIPSEVCIKRNLSTNKVPTFLNSEEDQRSRRKRGKETASPPPRLQDRWGHRCGEGCPCRQVSRAVLRLRGPSRSTVTGELEIAGPSRDCQTFQRLKGSQWADMDVCLP